MTMLPQTLRRLPHVLYVVAVILGVWRIYNELSLAHLAMQYGESGGASTLSKSISIYWGVIESIYLVASAAIIHVLIAIYDQLNGKSK